MGADGGSIPKRADLVKTRKRPVQGEPTNKSDPWKYCYLTRQPLTAPIVACPRGKLYNKEAVLKHLLLRAAGDMASETDPLPHIRGLRDLRSLRLTPNPAYERPTKGTTVWAGERTDEATSPFVCPVTGKDMNGNFRFGYLRPCGCVMAEIALDNIKVAPTTEACPQCGARCGPNDFIILNDGDDEKEGMAKSRVKGETLTEKRKIPKVTQPSLTSLPPSPRRSPDPHPAEELSDNIMRGMATFRKTPAVASLYTSNKSS